MEGERIEVVVYSRYCYGHWLVELNLEMSIGDDGSNPLSYFEEEGDRVREHG